MFKRRDIYFDISSEIDVKRTKLIAKFLGEYCGARTLFRCLQQDATQAERVKKKAKVVSI